jgi:Winged helix DNA-binding domain
VRASAIARVRLQNQRLSASDFTTPQEVVRWLGAVQAQDFDGAKWALAQRVQQATDDGIEKAFAEGSILRTHVLRPTWHFVAPADIRWMLELTAARVTAAMASYFRKYSLDHAVFKRSNQTLSSALREGGELTRRELRRALRGAGIDADGLRLVFILLRAELDGIVCSGGRTGKQFTYALLDRRVPESRVRSRAQALKELTMRYFTSRGPATVHDFAWWSGLTVADVRAGIEMAGDGLHCDDVNGTSYWSSEPIPRLRPERTAYLLPPYDEYLIAYRDRSAALHPFYSRKGIKAQFASTIVIGGQMVGTWRRTLTPKTAVITLSPFAELRSSDKRAIFRAARRYGAFVGRPTMVEG